MNRMLVARAASDSFGNWRDLFARTCAWTPHPLPVGGSDVLAEGVSPGPEVGRILAALTEWWIGTAFKAGRTAALAQLQKLVPKR